jgi:hypothetical protein
VIPAGINSTGLAADAKENAMAEYTIAVHVELKDPEVPSERILCMKRVSMPFIPGAGTRLLLEGLPTPVDVERVVYDVSTGEIGARCSDLFMAQPGRFADALATGFEWEIL